MKRVSRQPALLSKSKVKSAHRRIDTSGLGSNNFFNQIKKRNGKARVCVVRSLGGIGDVLMTLPALKELKRRFPRVHLTYAVDRHRTKNDVYYELVKNLPFIDKIVDARYVVHRDYDAVVDISAVCIKYERTDLPSINRIDLFGRRMGLTNLRDKLPTYILEKPELAKARRLLKQRVPEGNHIVALHTASFSEKRSWPPKYIRWVLNVAEEKQLPISFLLFDFNNKIPNRKKYSNVVDVSATDLREMAALIHEADLFIGPDSGPMHLAAAVKTKSLVLFGSVPPGARINHYPTHESIQHPNLSCLGCWYKACPYRFKCMKDLRATIVYDRMLEELGVSNAN